MLGKMAYMAYQLDTPVDKIRQLSMIDAKKHILHRSTLAWLITNGYIPQGSDYVMANGVPKALPESSSGRSPLPATSGPGPGLGTAVRSTALNRLLFRLRSAVPTRNLKNTA